MDLSSQYSLSEMESIPDGQGALLELEALEMWKEFIERAPSPVVEKVEVLENVEEDRSWAEDVHLRSVEGQKGGGQGVVTQIEFLPLEELVTVVAAENQHEMEEDTVDPDFIPDGQEEWLEMERKAGRYYD